MGKPKIIFKMSKAIIIVIKWLKNVDLKKCRIKTLRIADKFLFYQFRKTSDSLNITLPFLTLSLNPKFLEF